MLRGHSGPVLGVAISPDGTRLATGSADGTAKIWDAADGLELLTLTATRARCPGWPSVPTAGGWPPAGFDTLAKLWDIKVGRELLSLRGHTDGVFGVAFSPDGNRLATGSLDRTAKIWDIRDGRELCTLRGHLSEVFTVAFSPGRKTGGDGKLGQHAQDSGMPRMAANYTRCEAIRAMCWVWGSAPTAGGWRPAAPTTR